MVGFGGEFVNERLFVFDLGATDDEEYWGSGVFDSGGKICNFFFDE